MDYYAFPNKVYDQPENLLAVLGSWWADMYAGRDQVKDLVKGKAQIETQSIMDLLELLGSLSRFTVPIYHTANWYPLYLRASQRNDAQTSLLRYNGAANFDAGDLYDVPVFNPFHAFPRPENLVSVPLIMNRFVAPTMTQSDGVDYILLDNAIIFRNNPFDDPRVAKRPVYQDGRIVDTEALIWVYRGQFDWDTIYRQFAYVIGLRLKSSAGYRELMNAIYDAMVGGTTRGDLLRALSAMTGVPLVREAEETIVDMVRDTENVVIITDLSVYKFGLGAEPVVDVGQTVYRGQALTDALQIHELNQGIVPATLTSMALGQGFLSTCFYADLVFENKEVPLVVDVNHPSGYTRVSWDLGGFPLDVQQFFDDLHARGVEEAERPVAECEQLTRTIRYPANDCDEEEVIARRGTLAHYLDLRESMVGEPTATMLPRTINPLKFLVENILRNNAYIVRVKTSGAGHGGVGLYNAWLLRKIIPPSTAMILIVDLTAAKDSVKVDQLVERVTTFTGMTPLTDVVNTVADRRVTVRVISGNCH